MTVFAGSARVAAYAASDQLLTTGDTGAGMFVLISGSVAVTARDGLGHVVPIVELGPGGFLAEAGMLAGRPRLVDARAVSDAEVLLVPAERLRTVLIVEAELGERIMRARRDATFGATEAVPRAVTKKCFW